MQANLKGITHPCPYCEKDGRQPTPEQFALHQINHNPMSNSTQNKVFNDLPPKDQKDIIRGAMKHAKKLQDEVIDTRNWEKRMYLLFEQFDITTLADISEILYEHASPYGEINTPVGKWVFINPINKQWFSKQELADARREVNEKIKNILSERKKMSVGAKALRTFMRIKTLEKESLSMAYEDGFENAIRQVLATLKEDEVEAQLKHWGYRKGIQQTAVKAEGSALNLDKLSGS